MIKLKEVCIEAERLIGIVVLFLAVFQGIFFVDKVSGGKSGFDPETVIFFCITLIIIIFGINKLLSILNNKQKKLLLYGLVIFWIVLDVLIITHVFIGQGVDDFDVRLQSHALAVNNYSNWPEYFKVWPNNVNITIFFSWIIRVFNLAGIYNSWWIFNVFLSLIIFATLLICSKIVKIISELKGQIFFWFVSIIYFPFYIAGLYSYTDPVATFFICLGFYELIKIVNDKNKVSRTIIRIILFSLYVTCGMLIKNNSAIFIIAAVIFVLIRCNFKKSIGIILILAATVSLGVLTQQVVQSHYGYKFSNKYAFPTEYWIGLSYNKYSNGTVIGNKHTFEYTAKIDGYENKKDRDTKLIKNEIKNLGVLGILRQYNNKVNVMFSDGTVGMVGRQNSLYPKFSKFTKLIDGENDVIVGMVSQSVYVVSLLSVIALSIKSIIKRKKIWLLDLFLIFFTGIFMFHVFLWEVETRYLFLTIPLLLSVGSSELVTTGTAKLNLNKVTSVRLKIVFVIFFLVFFEQTFFNNKGLMVTKIFNEPVQEQTFFRMSPQVIPAHHRLKQNFILNDEPNFADVDIGSLNSKIKVKIVDRATGKSVIKNRKSDGYALIRNSGNLSISVTNISSKPTTILINESNLPSKIDVYGTSGIKINKRKEVFLNETFYKRVTDQRLHDLYKIISAIVVILVIIIIFII